MPHDWWWGMPIGIPETYCRNFSRPIERGQQFARLREPRTCLLPAAELPKRLPFEQASVDELELCRTPTGLGLRSLQSGLDSKCLSIRRSLLRALAVGTHIFDKTCQCGDQRTHHRQDQHREKRDGQSVTQGPFVNNLAERSVVQRSQRQKGIKVVAQIGHARIAMFRVRSETSSNDSIKFVWDRGRLPMRLAGLRVRSACGSSNRRLRASKVCLVCTSLCPPKSFDPRTRSFEVTIENPVSNATSTHLRHARHSDRSCATMSRYVRPFNARNQGMLPLGLAVERTMTTKHFVQNHTNGPNIRAWTNC